MSNLTLFQRGYGRRKPGGWARVDWSHPISRSLFGCWLFTTGGGDVRDLSPNLGKNTFVRNGTTTWQPGPRSGPALSFDGTSGYLDAGADTSLDVTTSFTIYARVQTPASFTSAYRLVVGKGTSTVSGTGRNYSLGLDAAAGASGIFIQANGLTGASFDQTLSSALSTSTWYDIAVVLDLGAGTYNIYVNGIVGNTQTGVGGTPAVATENLVCGRGVEGWSYLNSSLDCILLWRRPLLVAELVQLYREPFCFLQQSSLAQYTSQSPPAGGYTADMFPFNRTFDVTPARRGVVSY